MWVRALVSFVVLVVGLVGLFVYYDECDLRTIFTGFVTMIMGYWMRSVPGVDSSVQGPGPSHAVLQAMSE